MKNVFHIIFCVFHVCWRFSVIDAYGMCCLELWKYVQACQYLCLVQMLFQLLSFSLNQRQHSPLVFLVVRGWYFFVMTTGPVDCDIDYWYSFTFFVGPCYQSFISAPLSIADKNGLSFILFSLSNIPDLVCTR